MKLLIENFMYYSPLISAMFLNVIAVVLVYGFIKFLDKKNIKINYRVGQLFIGLIFGLCVIYSNEIGNININGTMLNLRNATPINVSLIFGAEAGIITGLIGGIERWLAVNWGAGEYTRIACSLACVFAGLISAVFKKFIFHNKFPKFYFGVFVTIIIEVFHCLLIFLTHLDDVRTAFPIIRLAAFPIILSSSITVLFSLLIINLWNSYYVKNEFGIVSKQKDNINFALQKGLTILMIFCIFISLTFQTILLNNATVKETEITISVDVEDFKDSLKTFDDDSLDDFLSNTEIWHVGDTGGIFIVNDYNNLNDIFNDDFILLSAGNLEEGQLFRAEYKGENCFCLCIESDIGLIVGYIPFNEAYFDNYLILYLSLFIYIVIFVFLFVLIYILVNNMIVKNVKNVNYSLEKISNGALDYQVNVRKYEEFDLLSNKINMMVDTLKDFILAAETKIDEELKLAKRIQYSALPNIFPSYPEEVNFELYAYMEAAKEVGGDFYDFYYIKDNKFVFLVADVSGKGIPAAMFMMESKSILKSLADSNMDIEEMANYANAKLCENNIAEMFITMFLCIIDIDTGQVEYINAGHNPPIIMREGSYPEFMQVKRNIILAGFKDTIYNKGEFTLKKGDILFLYTDGLTDANNIHNEFYGEKRVLENIYRNRLETIENLCNNIKDDIDSFVGAKDMFDDITMLIFKYKGVNNEGN